MDSGPEDHNMHANKGDVSSQRANVVAFPALAARTKANFTRIMREKCDELGWSTDATAFVISRLNQIDAAERHMIIPRDDWMHLSASAIWNLAAAYLEAWDGVN